MAPHPPKVVWNEAHWIRRAEETRTIAESTKDAECKRVLIGIAEGYEYLARQSRAWVDAAKAKAARPMSQAEAPNKQRPRP